MNCSDVHGRSNLEVESGYGKGKEYAELRGEPLKNSLLSFEVLSEHGLGSLGWLLPAWKGEDRL